MERDTEAFEASAYGRRQARTNYFGPFSFVIRLPECRRTMKPPAEGDPKMFKKIRTAAVKRTVTCFAVALCLAASLSVPAGAGPYRVRVGIANNSSYDIYRLYMSSTQANDWGRDLLGDSVLLSGSSFSVTADPGRYDLKLVDEDGDTCTVMGLSLYGNESWNITDRWLLSCEFHRSI